MKRGSQEHVGRAKTLASLCWDEAGFDASLFIVVFTMGISSWWARGTHLTWALPSSLVLAGFVTVALGSPCLRLGVSHVGHGFVA